MRESHILRRVVLMSLFFMLASITAVAEHRLTVLTWNIAGGNCGSDIFICEKKRERKPNLAEMSRVIARHTPAVDAVALQETSKAQAEELAERLTKLVGSPYRSHFIRTKEQCLFGNAIIVRTSRYAYAPLLTRRLPQNVQDPSDYARKEYTVLGGVRLTIANRHAYLYTAHTAAGGYGFYQMAKIQEYIASDHPEGTNKIGAVLAGDFNFAPLSFNYQFARNYFRDTWLDARRNYAQAGHEPDSTQRSCRQFQHLDYIFLGKNSKFIVRNLGAGVIRTDYLRLDHLSGLSDHRPVYATMYFN